MNNTNIAIAIVSIYKLDIHSQHFTQIQIQSLEFPFTSQSFSRLRVRVYYTIENSPNHKGKKLLEIVKYLRI